MQCIWGLFILSLLKPLISAITMRKERKALKSQQKQKHNRSQKEIGERDTDSIANDLPKKNVTHTFLFAQTPFDILETAFKLLIFTQQEMFLSQKIMRNSKSFGMFCYRIESKCFEIMNLFPLTIEQMFVQSGRWKCWKWSIICILCMAGWRCVCKCVDGLELGHGRRLGLFSCHLIR